MFTSWNRLTQSTKRNWNDFILIGNYIKVDILIFHFCLLFRLWNFTKYTLFKNILIAKILTLGIKNALKIQEHSIRLVSESWRGYLQRNFRIKIIQGYWFMFARQRLTAFKLLIFPTKVTHCVICHDLGAHKCLYCTSPCSEGKVSLASFLGRSSPSGAGEEKPALTRRLNRAT